MQAFLDDVALIDLPQQPGAEPTVRQIVDFLRERLTGEGRYLVGIRADGAPIGPDLLDDVLATTASQFERLEFDSVQPHSMVRETLDQALAAFAAAMPLCEAIADLLTNGKNAEAMEQLAQCFSVWSKAHEAAINSAALIGIDLRALVIDDRPSSAWMDDVVDQLRALRDALAMGDTVLTADLLRYELGTTLKAWERVLVALRNETSRLEAKTSHGAATPAA